MYKILIPFLLLVSTNVFAVTDSMQEAALKQAHESYYNTQSTELTSGKVKSQTVNIKNLPQPIFIISSDELSLNWLDKYHKQLKKINALGFIVNIKNYAEYKNIADKYDLPLFPVNGDRIAKKFNIHHYPALISKYRIEQ